MNFCIKTLAILFVCLISFKSFSKSFNRKARVIHVDSSEEWNKPWYNSRIADSFSIDKLMITLSKSKTGRAILSKSRNKALSYGQTLEEVIAVGNSSLTDTTLIRKFSPSDPESITYETRSKVYVNKSLSFKDAVLDLAHELVHYSYRMPFNPYLTQFTVDQFVSSVIEGKGGEVDAYIVECKVLRELRPSTFKNNSNCQNVVDPYSGSLSKKVGVQKFYEVGDYESSFFKILNKFGWKKSRFPKISRGDALYISSAYGLPYPVAAVTEYTTIMDKACQNDYSRLTLMRERISQASGRFPASHTERSFSKLFSSYRSRCSQFHR